jgi:phosphatidylinositol glycan class W
MAPNALRNQRPMLIAVVIMSVYQCCLSFTSLENYMLYAPRSPHDWISMNREGAITLLGYTSLYLCGMSLGARLANQRKQNGLLFHYMACTLLALFLYASKRLFHLEVSRRMTNLPFVLWTLFFNYTCITLLSTVDLLSRKCRLPSIPLFLFEAVNRNLLPLFLLANMTTGLVNMSIKTLHASYTTSAAVLLVYSLSLCMAVGWLQSRNVTLKFW